MARRWPPRRSDARVAIPALLVLGYLWLFVLRGCGGPHIERFTAPVTSSTAVPVPAAAVDHSGTPLPVIDGTTTSTVVSLSGRARLSGSVVGSAGPVPGAVVRAERFVGDAVAGVDVTAGPDGRWDLPGVAGGRWRVRAWLAPALAQTEPEILFLPANEERSLDLVVEEYSGVGVAVAVAPDPPLRGAVAGVAIQVAVRSVDPDGVVRSAPLTGRLVELTGTGTWALRGPNPVVTDAAGQAHFALECLASGPNRLGAVVRGTAGQPDQFFDVAVPDCVEPAVTTGSAPPGSPSTPAGPTTGPSSTPTTEGTTTTR